ncbi:reticulon-2-like isoform X2 [Heterodontus francisci]|uniref:reticulon-2-like isoform X2 n=1 Tax=Heterodontus francisci TaxID=7792 RepID=UPI00355C36D7
MGLHHLGQVMGQVLGFGHCKESASTVSTTPDSTPSSTEGVSEETDFLEPQTAEEHSDDDVQTDSSLYWGTPRQMSLESTLSIGTPLGQPPCFPGGFPSSSSPELTVRAFAEGANGSGVRRPSESDVPHRTKERTSQLRGVIRTETIETFLAEEEDDTEEYHFNLFEMTDQQKDKVEREIVPEPRDRADWDPLQTTLVLTTLGSALTCRDHEETKVPKLRLSKTEMEPQAEGILKGDPELELLPMEESGDWEAHEISEAHTAEVETEADEERFLEGGTSNQTELGHGQVLQVMRLNAEPHLVMMTEPEFTSSDPSFPPVTEAEGMAGEMEVMEAASLMGTMEETGSIGTVETTGSIDRVMPAGVTGTVDAVLPGSCDCCVYTNNATGCQNSLALVTAPSGYEIREVTDEETRAEDWQSPQQPSALDQSDHPKSQGLEAIDQSATDLLYWEDVKKTSTLFGAIVLILFSLTQFSGISVLAYLTLSVLSVTISLRLYTAVLHLIYKTQEVHPFQVYLDLDINLSQEQFRKYSEIMVLYMTSAVTHLRRLFLVEDLLDSLKPGPSPLLRLPC